MTENRFTLVDDYLIGYDGSYFDLHKPSDIRSLVTVIRYVTDENEQLKNKYVDEFALRETLQLELQRIENENKELKQKINELQTNKAIGQQEYQRRLQE